MVYKMECLSNSKSYIGITNDLAGRLAEHWAEAKRGEKSVLNNTIRKYGKEQFIIIKIDDAKTRDEVCEKEAYYIQTLKTKRPHGLNMTDGGEGVIGLEISEETRAKKRLAHQGDKNGNCKLTEQDVIDIRKLYSQGGISQYKLAEKYSVYRSTISSIIRGRLWPCISDGILTACEIKERTHKSHKRTHKGENSKSIFTEFDVISLRERYKNENISFCQLAKRYNASPSCIGRIIKGETWSHIRTGILSSIELEGIQSEIRKRIARERNNRKLKKEDVLNIRKRYVKENISQAQLGREFGVSKNQIHRIVHRNSWTYI